MASSGGETARRAVADKVARLNDLALFGAFDEAELAALDAGLGDLLERFDTDRASRPSWWESDADSALSYRARSPFCGRENPRAAGLELAVATAADGTNHVVGTATIDKAFAGPPGAVHGGVLAGLFDEVAGSQADLSLDRDVDPHAVAFTGRLTVRYRRPTRLRTPLEFRATTTKATRRRVMVHIDCVAEGAVTAEAEALMVVQR